MDKIHYEHLDTSTLTVDSVRADEDYIRTHQHAFVAEYIGLTAEVLRGLRYATAEEKGALFDALAAYLLDGAQPDLEAIAAESRLAAAMVDVVISQHEKRFESAIVGRYAKYVGAKKGRIQAQAKAAGIMLPDDNEGM